MHAGLHCIKAGLYMLPYLCKPCRGLFAEVAEQYAGSQYTVQGYMPSQTALQMMLSPSTHERCPATSCDSQSMTETQPVLYLR